MFAPFALLREHAGLRCKVTRCGNVGDKVDSRRRDTHHEKVSGFLRTVAAVGKCSDTIAKEAVVSELETKVVP